MRDGIGTKPDELEMPATRDRHVPPPLSLIVIGLLVLESQQRSTGSQQPLQTR